MKKKKPVSAEEFEFFKNRVRVVELCNKEIIKLLVTMLSGEEIDPELIKQAQEAILQSEN